MADARPPRPVSALFGRRVGKPLRAGQAEALAWAGDHLRIDPATPGPSNLTALFSAPVERIRLEIGFGGGEHLLARAQSEPGVGFIGVEPFVNGMAKLAAAAERDRLANLRTYDGDATHILDWLADASIDGIDLLYPDPWPKKRHWKRRFVSQPNLDRFARVLKPGGQFRFASDIAHYVDWTLIECRRHGAFDWLAAGPDDWRQPFPGWPGTRYETKALREGRTPAYLTFARVRAEANVRND